MLKERLTLPFYFSVEGEKDNIPFLLTDCFDRCAYFVMKHSYKDVPNPAALFLDDLHICVQYNESGMLKDIIMNEKGINRDIYTVKQIEGIDSDAFKELERNLDKGKYVVIQTVNEYLPHLVFYKPEFDINKFIPAHGFLAIGHDEENVYFVDSPEIIVDANFVSCRENRYVGVLKKSFLKELFSYYCRCYVITINDEKIRKPQKDRILDAVKESVTSYFMKQDKSNGVLYGREALLSLIALCDNEMTILNYKKTDNMSVCFFLAWKFWGITNLRKLLLAGLKKYSEISFEQILKDIMVILDKLIGVWERSTNIIIKNNAAGINKLDSKCKEYLTEVLTLEDKLQENLKKMC